MQKYRKIIVGFLTTSLSFSLFPMNQQQKREKITEIEGKTNSPTDARKEIIIELDTINDMEKSFDINNISEENLETLLAKLNQQDEKSVLQNVLRDTGIKRKTLRYFNNGLKHNKDLLKNVMILCIAKNYVSKNMIKIDQRTNDEIAIKNKIRENFILSLEQQKLIKENRIKNIKKKHTYMIAQSCILAAPCCMWSSTCGQAAWFLLGSLLYGFLLFVITLTD